MVFLVEDAALGPVANILLSYGLRLFIFDGVFLAVLLERTGGVEVKRFAIAYLWRKEFFSCL